MDRDKNTAINKRRSKKNTYCIEIKKVDNKSDLGIY